MYSLLSQKAGNLNIQAMVDTEMLLLSKVNQEKLYLEIPKFERFFRIITEKSLVAHQQRLVDNLSLTAQQRYKKFCTIYPNLINELPQKQIAAYIGVTPEFLSKMKAQMFKKNK
jgi:CRP-like cAMP-binding protein